MGEFPPEVITAIGRQIIYSLAVGRGDISGDDFGKIFAEAIGGMHLASPEGVADVVWKKCAWSAKTVKSSKPFLQKRVRLISGRNSPIFSYSATQNPRENPQETGGMVLGVWNERIGQARGQYNSLRTIILLRSMENLEFAIFESELGPYIAGDYSWRVNNRGNLEGRDGADRHTFTWQPHGSQFTVIRDVPASAEFFRVRRPDSLPAKNVLDAIGYDDSWVIRESSNPRCA